MGQKVNPIIFRQAVYNPQICSWFSEKNVYSQLNNQDLEIRNFLVFLLKSRGIVLRSCKIDRSSQKLSIDLDLYFSYLLSKQSKSLWAKTFFKTIKKKYSNLNRIKDLKNFLENLNKKDTISLESHKKNFRVNSAISLPKKNFLEKRDLLISDQKELSYKHRFFFFLMVKEKKKFLTNKKKKMSILGLSKKSNLAKIVRIKIPKLKKLFVIKKLFYNFSYFFSKKIFQANRDSDLLTLNKYLCKSLQHFTGLEKIQIRLFSNQLSFVPSLKVYYPSLIKELSVFQRNRDLNKYFFETLETLYFVLGTFSYGNASLLAKLLTFLLENNRKHVSIVRFIKKVIGICFEKLPSSFFAINGIKILIKGRLNKRRRTKTFIIQQGQIALQTLQIPLDYCQTHAVTLYGTFGIKVWLSKSTNIIQ